VTVLPSVETPQGPQAAHRLLTLGSRRCQLDPDFLRASVPSRTSTSSRYFLGSRRAGSICTSVFVVCYQPSVRPRAAMSFFRKAAPPPVPPPPIPRSGPEIDATTIISLLSVLALLAGAYGASIKFLPKTATLKTRVLFVWHLFDALIHFVFEGSFLWNCFFVSYSMPTTFSAASRNHPQISFFTPPDVYWLGREDLLYGANYGTTPFSRLWQEYAKADKRWGGVDLTVVSLEILTVFVAGPLACWICYQLSKDERKGTVKKYFWMIVLATAEIYGGESPFQLTTPNNKSTCVSDIQCVAVAAQL
jgi:hypothetical protein